MGSNPIRATLLLFNLKGDWIMLVSYVRCQTTGRPVATVVAIDKENIGVAVCNPKDNFSKARGIQIAEGRALRNPYRFGATNIPEKVEFIVGAAVNKMEARAAKYFK